MRFLLLLLLAVSCHGVRKLQVLYGWKTIDFKFASKEEKESMIQSGMFVEGNSVPLDVDTWQSGSESRVFVTLPRLAPGIPATLTTISARDDSSPRLAPFPDWNSQRQQLGVQPNQDCHKLTSVFRIQVDTCGRLWVLDTGRVDILTNFELVCPSKIVVYDLKNNDREVARHVFPHDSVVVPGSLPVTIAVDTAGGCRNTFAYAADVTKFGLLVYDLSTDHSWRITSNLFYPYPISGLFNIAGDSFDLMDGLLGLSLSPVRGGAHADRLLYFHSLASVRESYVPTSVIQNASLFEGGVNHAPRLFGVYDKERVSQSAAAAVDDNGVMFFGLLSKNSLNCWNGRLPYGMENIVEVDRDDVAMQFASGVKVTRNTQGEQEVWMVSCRFQKLMNSGVNPSEVNFRVLRARVQDLVRGTSCEQRGHQHTNRPAPHLVSSRPYSNQYFVWRLLVLHYQPQVYQASAPPRRRWGYCPHK